MLPSSTSTWVEISINFVLSDHPPTRTSSYTSTALTTTSNKLGLSCAKLRASLNFFGFDEILIYFNWLTYFEFANLAYELNFGALLLLLWKVWFGLFCSVWNTWFCRLGLVDLASFSLIKVLFIFNAIFIFEFLFIIQFIF